MRLCRFNKQIQYSPMTTKKGDNFCRPYVKMLKIESLSEEAQQQTGCDCRA